MQGRKGRLIRRLPSGSTPPSFNLVRRQAYRKVDKTMIVSGKERSGETPQRAAVKIRVSYPSYESWNPEETARDWSARRTRHYTDIAWRRSVGVCTVNVGRCHMNMLYVEVVLIRRPVAYARASSACGVRTRATGRTST